MKKNNSGFPENLQFSLSKRKEEFLFRELQTTHHLIDFCSNDYLNFNHSIELNQLTKEKLIKYSNKNGSGGSRLLAGNHENIENLEQKIASFHNADSGLIFNSGYDANIGLLSSIGKKDDVFLYDELIHASLHDGIRLSLSKYFKFRHNDVADLERLLKKNASFKNVYVIVESVYSMDGDLAPLKQLVELKKHFSFYLIVDEAHATGVFGEQGKGLCNELKIEEECFARIHTFGKALGVHGAIVLGNLLLRDFLINFSRSFIYTTALSPHAYASIEAAYELINETKEIEKLQENISYFNKQATLLPDMNCTQSSIQTYNFPGNENVSTKSELLKKNGFDVRAIKSPTVKQGAERLRICLHSFNSKKEIDGLLEVLKSR
jgi:8-amino-7-oxononanoate synthase